MTLELLLSLISLEKASSEGEILETCSSWSEILLGSIWQLKVVRTSFVIFNVSQEKINTKRQRMKIVILESAPAIFFRVNTHLT